MPFKGTKTKSSSNWRSLHVAIKFGKQRAFFDIKPEGDDEKDTNNESLIGTNLPVDNTDLPQSFQNVTPGTILDDAYVLFDLGTPKKAIAINPWNGVFEAICFELGSAEGRTEDNLPQFEYIPKEDARNRYHKDDIKKFYAAYEISEDTEFAGLFKGAKPRYHLQHLFVDNGSGMADIRLPFFYKGKRTNSGKLLDWAVAHEIDADMEWPTSEDCLPELERRILELNKPVRITIQRGWITDVSKARGASIRVVAEEEPTEKPGTTDETFGVA